MSGDRQQVAADRFDIDRHLAGRLDRVRVKPDLMTGIPHSADEPADLFNGLNSADLVICHHYRYQNGLVGDGVPYVLDPDHAVFINGQPRNAVSDAFEVIANIFYG